MQKKHHTLTWLGVVALVCCTVLQTPPRAIAAPSNVIDVRDIPYGARCDGVTDDSAAFNAAISAARTRSSGGAPVNAKITWAGCIAMIRGTLNFTGFQTTTLTIEGSGGMLLGATGGKPVIDALHTKTVKWRDVAIYGIPGLNEAPNIGMQIGRIATSDASDGNEFDNLSLTGAFSFAAFYNFGSEIAHFNKLTINNAFSGSGSSCYGLVQDGTNHWGARSDFISQTVSPDTNLSFDLDLFDSPNITATAGCTPLWLGGVNGHKFVNGYASNFSSSSSGSGAGYIAVLWNPAGSANTMLEFDNFHSEQYPTDLFYITGANRIPFMSGFRYEDNAVQATNSIFKLDPAITTATMVDLNLRIVSFTSQGLRVFDNPNKWIVRGSASLASPGHWNGPTLSGVLAEGGNTSLFATSISSSGGVAASGFSTGTDPLNGALNLGLGAGTGTPYIDFYGVGRMRLITDLADQLTISDRAFGPVASFRGIPTGGGAMNVNGPITATSIIGSVSHTPTSSSEPCIQGQESWDSSFEYRCTSSGYWRRTAFAPWPQADTPYTDFNNGTSSMRIGTDAPDRFTISDRTLGPIASFTGASGGGGSVTVNGPMMATAVVSSVPHTPSSSTEPCTPGLQAWDAYFEYRCTANKSWGRNQRAIWPSPVVTYALQIQPNFLQGPLQTVTLSGSMLLLCPIMAAGSTYELRFIQDSVGGRSVTWPVCFKWPGGIQGMLSSTPNATDLLTIVSFDGIYADVSLQKSFQ